MPPKGRGAEAEINLAIDSDSLPLGTPSLAAKPKSIEIADSVLNRLQKLTHLVSRVVERSRISAAAEEGI